MDKKWCAALLLFVYQLSDCILGSQSDEVKLNRTKRGLICDLGLTHLIVDALQESLEEIHELDPLDIKNEVSITRLSRLHDGILKGLSTLTNITELKVFCNDDDVIIFTTTLRMRNAEIFYKWTSKSVFKFKLQGSVWMKASVVDYNLEICLNTTGGMNFEVTNSLITKMDDFKIGFKGLGLLNPLVKGVMKLLFKMFRVKTETRIALVLKEVMETKLDKIADSLNDSYLSWLF